jgi:geranyl diphosphate 2-C-methyltransferase
MALTRGGYELGATQQALTEGVRRYYDRQQSDRNLLLSGDSGIVNHHFGIGDFDRSLPLEDLSQEEIAAQLNRLEMSQIDVLLARMGPVAPGQRVLDAGCGRGGTALSIASRLGASVDAITISPYQQRFAAALAERSGTSERVRFQLMDYLKLDFPDASFDHVLTNESTQYVLDLRDLLAGFARVLRPGGRYTCATWCTNEETQGDNEHAGAIDLHYGTHIHSRADYLDAMRKHGFGAIEVDDLTEQAIPYWELRCQWQHRSGVELDFLLGHRTRKILYLFIHGRLE